MKFFVGADQLSRVPRNAERALPFPPKATTIRHENAKSKNQIKTIARPI
jgi:hypothetical protein